MGAVYDDTSDKMMHVMDGEIDEMTLHHRALSAVEASSLVADVPCAKRFRGSGFAYFPGQAAKHGAEFAAFDQVPQCREGPHTVRFRHLVSRGNNRRLTVSARTDGTALKQSAAVVFPEPYRFDSLDQYTWAYSPPALLRMQAGKLPLVKLGTDGGQQAGAQTPEHTPGSTNPEVAEVEEEAAEEGHTTLEDEMLTVNDPVLDRDSQAKRAMETVAGADKLQVEKGGKYVNRRHRRRSLLAELSAADPPRPILTEQELAWVSDAMGGAELSTPRVVYDMDDDPKRSASVWLDSCARHTLKGGREMVVVVVELNTGKKVVGTTEVGWNSAAAGHRDDHHAALYEVTGQHVWRPGANYPNAVNIQNGPLTYRAASFGLMGTDFHMDDRLSTGAQHTGSCRPGRSYKYFKTAASSRGAFDSRMRSSSNDFTDDGLEPKDQGVAMCGGEGWRVVRMQTWVVASPDQTILRPGERKWLGQTLGMDMSRPSPCFVRKRGDELTAANFIDKCHAKEDQEGVGYVLVTVTVLETGRKVATRTIVADHDSMFTSMYELTTEQINPAVVDLKQRLNPNVRCDGASAASESASASNSASASATTSAHLGAFAAVEGETAGVAGARTRTRTQRQLLGGPQPGHQFSAPVAVSVNARAAPPPPAGGLPVAPCFSGFRADGSMGLAFGGQAAKSYSLQKSIAAFHVDKNFEKASCNGWGDAYAFGDPSTANFGDERRRQLLCGQTEDVPILNFEAYVLRIKSFTSDVSAADWSWLGGAFGGADMATRRECYSYDLRRGDAPYELMPGNERPMRQEAENATAAASPESAAGRRLLGGDAPPPAPTLAPVPAPADLIALCYCNRYADLRNALCDGKQCTTFAQGNACASHWNTVGWNEVTGRNATTGVKETRLWGCITAADMATIEAAKVLALQTKEWVPEFGKQCAGTHMGEDEMLVVSAVLSTGKHIFGRVFNQKWFQGHYTDPVDFGVNPPVVDPGAMLVELTGRRIYRNIFTEKPVLSVDRDWGYSFNNAISFLPHKRIAYVEGVGFESFLDEKDMALRHRKEQCLKTAYCYGDRHADLKTEFCGNVTCSTVEQGMKLEDHWNFKGRFNKAYMFRCGAQEHPERTRVLNALCYGNRFKDLVDSVCSEGECVTDEEAAALELHYKRHGKLDNRQWGCTPTTAELCYGDANIKWDLSDTSKRCIDAHGVSDASLRASAGARAVVGVQSFSAYFVKRPFSNATDKTPMWTANETAWVSSTLNKAAGRDDAKCSMCATMWDATCFDTRVYGLSMKGLTERCGGKLNAAAAAPGEANKMLLVAAVLDNGRKVLGTTTVDPGYTRVRPCAVASTELSSANQSDAPDVPCTMTDALCYGNRNPYLVNSLCEGVQCATMTHVWKLERHWRDVGRSDPASRFGCTVDDAALCYGNRRGLKWRPLSFSFARRFVLETCTFPRRYLCSATKEIVCGPGNRYTDLRSEYCGGQRCTTPDQAESLEVHWKFHGAVEDRKFGCAPSYESLCYGNRYTDLRADVCGGGECKTQEQAFKLATHWKESGHLQGRRFGCDMTADTMCYADKEAARAAALLPRPPLSFLTGGECVRCAQRRSSGESSHALAPPPPRMYEVSRHVTVCS